ncbi:MAG: DUF2437 domain-containing protein [Gemmatimonadaceae bacterium]
MTTVRILAVACLLPTVGVAQERLLGRHTAGLGAAMDFVRFGAGGVMQYGLAGHDSLQVLSAHQFSVPFAVATPLGERWRLDVTALHASGGVTVRDPQGGKKSSLSLSGLSDVRLRASGRFLSDALTLTFGMNAPTGRRSLDGGEYGALRVLAAPALAMSGTPVGTGPSATAGIVVARPMQAWLVAAGASYEHRGNYQPIAAITAGAPSADYRPGAVVRTSLAAERTVGSHRLSAGLAADVFAADRLRGVPDDAAAGTSARTLATVKLGPVFTADAQLQLAARGWREMVVHGAWLWRAAYARDGITADQSSGRYLEGGIRGVRPVSRAADIVLATSGRWHSGLGVERTLATSGVLSADATLGFRMRRGLLALQPFARAQAGQLRWRKSGAEGSGVAGMSGGIVLQGRF